MRGSVKYGSFEEDSGGSEADEHNEGIKVSLQHNKWGQKSNKTNLWNRPQCSDTKHKPATLRTGFNSGEKLNTFLLIFKMKSWLNKES